VQEAATLPAVAGPRRGNPPYTRAMAPVTPLSDAIQHYLREVYKLEASGGRAGRARGDPPPPPARALPCRDARDRRRRGARRGRPAGACALRGARGAD